MLEIIRKGNILKYMDVYFSDDTVVNSKCDVCTYHNLYSLHSSANKNTVEYTLISDLSIPKEELWSLLHKSTKYDIRRSERYNVKYETYDSQAIKDQERFDWNSFSSMYERMFSEKDLPRSIDREWFNSIIFAGGGYITVAKIDNSPIVYHFYIYDQKHTKLTISCSDVWSAAQNEDKNLIGYVNKGLHWHDILLFKDMGITSYDWGGVTWNEEDAGVLKGINKFKESFGGQPVSYYSETVVLTLKAKLFLKLKKVINKR